MEKLGVEHQEIEQQYEFIFVKYQDILAYAQIASTMVSIFWTIFAVYLQSGCGRCILPGIPPMLREKS